MMDLLGIEPRTFPMLRENYTTKPQALSWRIEASATAG